MVALANTGLGKALVLTLPPTFTQPYIWMWRVAPSRLAITVNRSFADRCPAFSGATKVEELVRDRW
jgi:hypothetical protein